MKETICVERGLCCENCKETIIKHRCIKCKKAFKNNDKIYCDYSSYGDSKHYHIKCMNANG
ncbi:hypothetical protein KKG81_13255 [bacterium]|nr:hypothetical protein [bacterium]